ncbi:EAL domain-containing protein [Vibrio campbellii]|uniref:EAL domain-containing protein n=1 Tax=Vibrio campbellii TaxID=680 RepID=UPI00215BA037|nr:EAL domain-containing protein [Vibrio campbellii]MCR9907806.1 EAL domain-containing protein [Vibrio campbellii]
MIEYMKSRSFSFYIMLLFLCEIFLVLFICLFYVRHLEHNLVQQVDIINDEIVDSFEKLSRLSDYGCDDSSSYLIKFVTVDNVSVKNVSFINGKDVCSSNIKKTRDTLINISPNYTDSGISYWFGFFYDLGDKNEYFLAQKNNVRLAVSLFELHNYLESLSTFFDVSLKMYDSSLYNKSKTNSCKGGFCLKVYRSPFIFEMKLANDYLFFISVVISFVNCFLFLIVRSTYNKFVLLKVEILNGILNGEFKPIFQPIVNAKEHNICGVEVLCRWHSNKGIVMPGDFIEDLEKFGFLKLMTRKLLQSSLGELESWLKEDRRRYLSLNISADGMADSIFLHDIISMIVLCDIYPSQIALEITENQLLNCPHANRNMEKIKNIGFKLFIDDFGTGYSNFSYLKELPLDVIKIDKSLIEDITTSEASKAVTYHIVGIAKSLGIQTVIEGVETKEQVMTLTNSTCADFFQGWYFSKPITASQLIKIRGE